MTENSTDTRPTPEEMIDSLLEFDEIAIEKHFGGVDFFDLKGVKTVRALVFVQKRREGLPDKEAREAVRHMTIGQVNACFTVEDETDPEQPVTPSGKDAEPPV